MKKLLALILCLQVFVLTSVMAQDSGSGVDQELLKSTQTDALIVVAAGAAGAILGLSTLSFVERPSEHLRNIYAGAALGIVAGVLLVTYNTAQKGTEDLESSVDFSTYDRVVWHADQAPDLTIPQVQFGTQFWQMNF